LETIEYPEKIAERKRQFEKLCPICKKPIGEHTHLEFDMCAEGLLDLYARGNIEIVEKSS